MLVTARWFTGIFVLSVMTGFANAQLSSDWYTCKGDPRGDWDRQISSCTALIRSGKESDKNVTIAYYNRALAYENKEDYERAIADYSEVIRLDPYHANALFFRSLNRGRIGDKNGAEADMVSAKRLDPNVGD